MADLPPGASLTTRSACGWAPFALRFQLALSVQPLIQPAPHFARSWGSTRALLDASQRLPLLLRPNLPSPACPCADEGICARPRTRYSTRVIMEAPEAHHAHPGHSGHRWLDIVLAVSAMFVSVISHFVAVG